ncbi:restriction endonuclease subunit S [Actinomadura sp. ATCC 31491]|uniref:Restriction endonuclease subunit S n=1 Tax=Actinomadura luzonensis TaxID=2805427 RepID=A0ABT0FP21_9ACTN|nr:restriction endonuclease subunit S [Actinomadura luzonensis]MCK2214057.1 restriction endonuclease subunit S [Actinomadura luzonensis]
MREARLSDAVDINPEALTIGTPGSFRFRYIDLSAVSRGQIFWNSLDTHLRASAPSRAQRLVRPHDCLLGTVRPLQQSHGYIEDAGEALVASTGFAVLRAKAGIAHPRFIFHWMLGLSALRQTDAMAVGSNYPAVNESDVANLKIALPSIGQQRRIAEILDTLDAQIRFTLEGAKKVIALRAAISDALIPVRSDPSDLGEGWSCVRLAEVVPSVEYGISTSLDEDDSGTPILRMNNLANGKIELGEVKYSSLGAPAHLFLRDRDVLFNRTNSIDHVGRTSIWRSEIERPTSFASYLVRLNPDLGRLVPEYLVRWLNRPAIQQRIRRFATPGVHQVNINPTNLRKTFIELPVELEHQRKIDAALVECEQTIERWREEEARLRMLKQGLMEDLLTGRVRAATAEAVLEKL